MTKSAAPRITSATLDACGDVAPSERRGRSGRIARGRTRVAVVDGSETSRYAIGASVTVARENADERMFCLTTDPERNADGFGVRFISEMAMQLGAWCVATGIDGDARSNEPVRVLSSRRNRK